MQQSKIPYLELKYQTNKENFIKISILRKKNVENI